MLALLIILSAALIGADIYVWLQARAKSYQNATAMPAAEFGLILGTAKYIGEQRALNRYYQNRIDAAVELWRAGKVKRFIASGSGLDNTPSETVCMQADLAAAGIPASAIWQDPAGLRTLDSIIRYRQSFGRHSVCIISQPFHNQRALMQAQACKLNACAYDARIIGIRAGWKIHARERAARLRLWYDLLCRQAPRYSIAEIPIKQYPTSSSSNE
ncbi:YdcF family protein [Uruburuella testudinis]|uniref:YdcF family protein n=1 Tax=Uruburuella testudinis TaxID=1282863 RepID=A0ABY4DRG1_9NEIS|nr:ElyC/SanA/YdcF family protein [Uruburuella testudinis]UOO80983.1 YdcF family protein [Uruburuella testudinis]